MYFLFLFGKKKRKRKGKKYFKGKKWVQQNKSDMFQCYNALHFLHFISKNFYLKNTKTQCSTNVKTGDHSIQIITGDIPLNSRTITLH